MKSEKAKEYINCIVPNKGNFDYCAEVGRLNGSVYMDVCKAVELAEQEAEERMRKELTRWHDPKEMLPEDNEVLCKIDKRLNTYEVMRHDRHGWWMRAPIPEGGWCACDYDIIGWRYIYE